MADLSAAGAFLAGLLAFFSPCVLPILPAYVGYMGGAADVGRGLRVARTVAFVLGFGAAFTALGLLVATAGSSSALSTRTAQMWIRWVGGGLVILFGLALTGLLRLPWMDRDVRFHGKAPAWLGPVGGAAFLGAGFAVGWSPCVGPLLATVLIFAGQSGHAAAGAGLLALFALGLAVPLLALGLAADQGAAFIRRFRKATRVLEAVGGVLLILLGILVVSDRTSLLVQLATW